MPLIALLRGTPRVRPTRCRGFTLTELAVVVLVIALLLGGLTLTLSAQTELRRIEDTQRALELAKEALIGFAITRGRLPCPADPTIATGALNAGVERADCWTVPNNQYGALPWVTLGVPETDAWSRRFSYRVFRDFADASIVTVGPTVPPSASGCLVAAVPVPPPDYPIRPSFQLCSIGNLNVKTRNAAGVAPQNIAADLAAVVISHGPNGFGGFSPAGTQLPAPAGQDEAANANAGTTDFISRELTRAPAGACNDTVAGTLCEFDDLVTWVPTVVLMNRMVASGKLP